MVLKLMATFEKHLNADGVLGEIPYPILFDLMQVSDYRGVTSGLNAEYYAGLKVAAGLRQRLSIILSLRSTATGNSALPSDSSLASPTALPTTSLTVPLICFADPRTRSLSIITSDPCEPLNERDAGTGARPEAKDRAQRAGSSLSVCRLP